MARRKPSGFNPVCLYLSAQSAFVRGRAARLVGRSACSLPRCVVSAMTRHVARVACGGRRTVATLRPQRRLCFQALRDAAAGRTALRFRVDRWRGRP